jgi:ArsR family transcriptional regulator
MTEAGMQDPSRLFKALSNHNRLAIFEFLREQGVSVDGPGEGDCCSVSDIAQQFDLALSTVSHHLRVLHEAGLIKCEQRGQFTYCLVDWETVRELREYF